jgi:hypothetical protein
MFVIFGFRGMMRDERYYPEPAVFNPDRFVHLGSFVDEKLRWTKSDSDEDSNIHAASADPFAVVYGFGRRSEFCFKAPFHDTNLLLVQSVPWSLLR